MKRTFKLFLAVTFTIAGAGCTAQGFSFTPTGQATPAPSKQPIVQSFTSNPSSGGDWTQVYTFNVQAHSPGNNVLSYQWTATGGTLSSTTGQLTSWTPPKKEGTYTVQVQVLDSVTGGSAAAAANITVNGSGSVTIAQ